MFNHKVAGKAKKISNDLILINAAIAAFGLFIIVYPWGAKEIVCRILAGLICVWGIFKIFSQIMRRKNNDVSVAGIVFGCLLLAIGVYVIISPEFLAGVLTVVLSVILFLGALFKLQYAVKFQKNNSKLWWVQAGAAILLIITSIIAFINPFGKAGNLIMIFIGIALVVDAIWDLLTIFYIKKKFGEAVKYAAENNVYEGRTIPEDNGKYVNTVAVDSDSENSSEPPQQ